MPFLGSKYVKIAFAAGALPRTPLGELAAGALPRNPLGGLTSKQGRFYVGAGGAQPPQMLARPPKYFGSNSKNTYS